MPVGLALRAAWRGFRVRRDTCPPRTPLRSRSSRSRTASDRHSSHSGGFSSLRTAVAGKARKRRPVARSGNRPPRPSLRDQRAESDSRSPLLGGPLRLPLNVRRLMYQSLIFAAVTGDDARGLAAALDAEDMERAADALVDGVRRNVELGRDFLRGQMVVRPAAGSRVGRLSAARRAARSPRPVHSLGAAEHIQAHHPNPATQSPNCAMNGRPPSSESRTTFMLSCELSPCFGDSNRSGANLGKSWIQPQAIRLSDCDNRGSVARFGATCSAIRTGWWRGLDSNQRTLARADLQSAAFNHSATSPGCHAASPGDWRAWQAGAPCGGAALRAVNALQRQECRSPLAVARALQNSKCPRHSDFGAGEGNRTLVVSLEGFCSTIELHPPGRRAAMPLAGGAAST